MLLALFLGSCLVSGCRRETVPDFDSLETQLFVEAMDTLAQAGPEKALNAFRRFDDVKPGEEFVKSAIDSLETELIVRKVNRQLAEGRLADLQCEVRRTLRQNANFSAWSAIAQVTAALDSLAGYLHGGPYATADLQERALLQLGPQLPILTQSSTFRDFIQEQRRKLADLRSLEALSALGRQLSGLDEAVVTGASDMAASLTALGASDAGKFVVPLEKALKASDGHALDAALDLAPGSNEATMALEILGWLHRTEVDPAMGAHLRKYLDQGAPVSRCGHLLKAWACLSEDRIGTAVPLLREAWRGLQPDPATVAEFIEKSVLPPDQFYAWCWASPCPGLSEYLVRLEQLRQQRQAMRK